MPATFELDPPERRALFILVFAALLWVTDAVPAFAVGILVIGLQVALLGTERGGGSALGALVVAVTPAACGDLGLAVVLSSNVLSQVASIGEL